MRISHISLTTVRRPRFAFALCSTIGISTLLMGCIAAEQESSQKQLLLDADDSCNATGQVFPVAVEASSQQGALGPEFAVDGDFNTRWSSEFSDPEWIMLDFGKAVRLNHVRLHWEAAASAHYWVETSTNGENWYALWEEWSGHGGVEDIPLLPSPARYMRIRSFERTTQWGNSLFEIEAFEEPEECVFESSCDTKPLALEGAWASSIQDSNFDAERAIDGDLGTRWSSAFSDPQWLTVDIGQEAYISGIELTWEGAASADYEIQVTNSPVDGFETVFADHNANGGVDRISGLNAIGRFVRIYSNSRLTGWGNSLFEVRIFGDEDKYCAHDIQGVLLPAVIEAEDYVNHYDLTPLDQGSGCGNGDAVDKEVTSDATGGGCNVGWTEPGEWLEYKVYSATDRGYTLMSRVASAAAGRSFHLELDGLDVSGPLTAPSYGWQEYEGVMAHDVFMTKGNHTLRVVFDTGAVNFNYLLLSGQ